MFETSRPLSPPPPPPVAKKPPWGKRHTALCVDPVCVSSFYSFSLPAPAQPSRIHPKQVIYVCQIISDHMRALREIASLHTALWRQRVSPKKAEALSFLSLSRSLFLSLFLSLSLCRTFFSHAPLGVTVTGFPLARGSLLSGNAVLSGQE